MPDELPTDSDGTLSAFAWPGGYPILYLDSDNSVLCWKCASDARCDDNPRFRPSGWFIHFEGPPEVCAVCSCEENSAYGG